MKKLQWTAGFIFSVCLIIVVLITSFEIAMYSDFSVYEKEYEKYHVLRELEMTMEDVMHVTEEMMAYLRGDREELSVITEVEGTMQDFFNEQDRFHMAEVRDLFIGGLNLRLMSCAVAIFCLVFLFVSKSNVRTIVCRSFQGVLGLTVFLGVLFGIAAAVDFNAVFVQFHHVFFDNDLWLFDPAEDYMIRMLPEGLFADMVVRIGLFFVSGLLLLFLLSILPDVLKRKKCKN